MHFSLATLALVAPLLVTVSAGPVVERGMTSKNLCDKANYGAVGKPWQSTSTPGSFCSSQKPSNSGQWSTLPYWDGGDKVKCTNWLTAWGLNVCYSTGNKASSLPKGCRPPTQRPTGSNKSGWVWGWNGHYWGWTWTWGSTTSASSTKASSTSTKSAAASTTAITTTSTTIIVPSSAAASTTAIPSSAAGVVVVSNSTSTSSVDPGTASSTTIVSSVDPAVASTTSTSTTDAAASITTATSATSATDSAAAATTSVPADGSTIGSGVATSTTPLCESHYQVQYLNYTVVAPNGVWTGMTVGAATQDASYITYTLATSVDDCLAACDGIESCVFVNSYYDVEDDETFLPKHTPGVLTCAMCSSCVPTSNNNNWGGQNDPNYITNSNGYCKSGTCGN